MTQPENSSTPIGVTSGRCNGPEVDGLIRRLQLLRSVTQLWLKKRMRAMGRSVYGWGKTILPLKILSCCSNAENQKDAGNFRAWRSACLLF